MPNSFAYLALYSWPIVVLFFYLRLPRAQALVSSIIGGYLLLPYGIGINPPVLPTLDKTLIPALSALVMSLLVPDPTARLRPRALADAPPDAAAPAAAGRNAFTRQPEKVATRAQARGQGQSDAPRPRHSRIILALILLMFLTPFVTTFTNGEPYRIGPRVLSGMRLYDAFSFGLTALVSLLPFLLGMRFLATPRKHWLLLSILCIWGLFYSLPTLFEIRMSPQLSRWIYGYLAQPFAMAMRDSGFRPVVFLQQGLWLAIFNAMVVLAVLAIWRIAQSERKPNAALWLLAGLWMFATLVLSHSLGALLITLLLLPCVVFLSPRAQIVFASLLAGMIIIYPVLRGSGVIPVTQIAEFANSISPARAQSLEFRLRNEDDLLAHANKKPLAGWGGYDRNRIFDPKTGNDKSTTDGAWIIVIGTSGWMGYLATFGLLGGPILLLALRRRKLNVGRETAGLALILTANLCDMIPNATLTPVTWLIAGALAGRLASPAGPEPAPRATRPSDRVAQGKGRARAMPQTRHPRIDTAMPGRR